MNERRRGRIREVTPPGTLLRGKYDMIVKVFSTAVGEGGHVIKFYMNGHICGLIFGYIYCGALEA